MPNKNLLRFLKPDVNLTSNGFDLSHRDVFSIKAGALNVAMYLPCVQGDYHEISPISYLTTMPFNTANFTRMKQHLDFFFVPYTCIQSRFYEWYQQTVDPNSSVFTDMQIDEDSFIPEFRVCDIVWALCYCAVDSVALNDLTHDHQITANVLGRSFLDSIKTRIPNIDLMLSYFYSPGDQEPMRKDKLGYPVYLNTVRLLDMLGYGNFLPLLKLPIFTGDISVIDTVYEPDDQNYDQALEDELSSIAQDFETFLSANMVGVSALNLAAYQAICQNYFINTHYERPNVKSYNFDDIFSSSLDERTGSPRTNGLTQLFTINYRPWKKDVYLSALPSPQFGEVSVVSVLTDRFKMSNGSNPSGSSYIGSTSTGTLYRNSNTTDNQISLVGSASVIDIRRAEALQYWREQIGRAGFRYDDRYRATFGDAPGFDPKILPVPIGSFVQDVNKDPVVGTSGDDFGDKRATGSSLLQNEVIKFKAPSFGVIIGLISILPESDYDAFMIDKNNIKFVPFDFFTPALQNLGLVPMNIRELSLYSDDTYGGNGTIIGYLPSYYEHKTAIDKLHGEFCTMPLMFMRSLKTSPVGQFSSFVSSRVDMESFVGSVRQYYVDPAVLDNIFLNDADDQQSSDQFHVSCYFDIKSYRPMSVLGLPQF